IRAVLEGYALRIISERITEEDLQHLGTFIDKAQEALEAGRMSDVFKWNTRFHDH
ncbi:MAG: FCD domain-containing protein, partial [Deltaproteobacteria bacterium]|nr:FCD domain-containing protein [Deltaproteobacteria bacterium]